MRVQPVIAALVSLSALGCASGPSARVLFGESPAFRYPDESTPNQAETASVVVPPSEDGQPWANGCPAAGRAFLAYGDGEHGATLLYTRTLDCMGQPGCLQAVPRNHPANPSVDKLGSIWVRDAPPAPDGTCVAGPDVPGSVQLDAFPHAFGGTDMQLARVPLLRRGPSGNVLVPGGRILHFWQAFRAVNPTYPAIDTMRWSGDATPGASCGTVVRHVGIMVRWSDDCGATWSEPTFIDHSALRDARGGQPFPMQVPHRGKLIARGPGVTWGTDRFEVYADPFGRGPSGQPPLYLSSVVVLPDPASGGPLATRSVDVVLRSLDGGVTWSIAHAFPDWGGSPKVMTSTETGRLFVSRCIGVGRGLQRLQLWWFDGLGGQVGGWAYVDYLRDGSPMDCRSIPSEYLHGSVNNNIVDVTIARVGHDGDADTVRVAYPGVEGPRQVLYAVRVKVPTSCHEGRCVDVTPEKVIVGAENRSILHPHFIETDRHEFTGSGGDAPAVLAFLEWPGSRFPEAGAVARFLAVGTKKWSEIGTLSFRAGQPSAWSPTVRERRFIGDYDYGAFFVITPSSRQPKLRYFTQWPQSDPSFPLENHMLRGNVVEVVP